ncbi:MAG: glutamate--tRNA ligase [Bacilli bacterium]|jgi:glutamyl-tRNA synthetase|nr:glutamate--tRNA ligase [Bacilli bacterium]
MDAFKQLAELIFPEIQETVGDLEKRYPPRNLKETAQVTRFAPSPTGFLHTGSLFTAMVAKKVAKDSGGIFFLRLEDTDTKREVSGSGEQLISQLAEFGITLDEGFLGDRDTGGYGPYRQSKRASIYKVVIKHLLANNLAYPCFCSTEELDTLRKTQEEQKVVPGYYGKYATCRYLSPEESIVKIKEGQPYVIRFRSKGDHFCKTLIRDLIRGEINIAENDIDIVILKSDGLPTYHFAHVVDDHFMHTTVVTRGEEWISSLPIHVEIFNAIGWKAPEYAHLPLIMKLENGNKRKLSKRKDEEAAVSFFIEDGYPPRAVMAYLMSIANSNFEEWTEKSNIYDIDKFTFNLDKMSLDGALFDLDKLTFFAKEVIARMSAHRLASLSKKWAINHAPELLDLINRNTDYYEQILNIEREKENPRKDFAKYSDIYSHIRFFYHDHYLNLVSVDLPFDERITKDKVISFLRGFMKANDYTLDNDDWFLSLKEIALISGFAPNNKEYKNNLDKYIGHVGDAAEILRISLTGSKNSPNLWAILQVLGQEEAEKRLNYVIEKLR